VDCPPRKPCCVLDRLDDDVDDDVDDDDDDSLLFKGCRLISIWAFCCLLSVVLLPLLMLLLVLSSPKKSLVVGRYSFWRYVFWLKKHVTVINTTANSTIHDDDDDDDNDVPLDVMMLRFGKKPKLLSRRRLVVCRQ
jgi:hypothetical protein